MSLVAGISSVSAENKQLDAKPVIKTQGVPEARFKTSEIKATAEPGQDVVELIYEFKNTGDFPLAVEDFSHFCGCMAGEWDGKPVLPGETGKIKAKFLTKGLRGTVRKKLEVIFFERGNVDLTAEVIIPEALDYSAQTLKWAIGEATTSKQVDITIHSKSPLKVLSVVANDPAFTCELKTIADASKYKIVITPNDTQKERICVLQVKTDAKDPRDALHGIFAVVENVKQGG